MPRPKPTPLSNMTVADLKALLAEKEIEVLKERQAMSKSRKILRVRRGVYRA